MFAAIGTEVLASIVTNTKIHVIQINPIYLVPGTNYLLLMWNFDKTRIPSKKESAEYSIEYDHFSFQGWLKERNYFPNSCTVFQIFNVNKD